jgi:nucleoside-diphosphate-sugar epimerase
MHADPEKIKMRMSYNLAGMSFAPEEIADSIKKHIPDFQIDYNPDYRQAIADTWPAEIDDSLARKHWGWKPDYDLASMTIDMLENIAPRYA